MEKWRRVDGNKIARLVDRRLHALGVVRRYDLDFVAESLVDRCDSTFAKARADYDDAKRHRPDPPRLHDHRSCCPTSTLSLYARGQGRARRARWPLSNERCSFI